MYWFSWFCLEAVIIMSLCGCSKSAIASEIPDAVAVRCLMGEARGEGRIGMQAVGEVLRRRGSTVGVYGCKAKIIEPERIWSEGKHAWRDSASSNLTNHATHFESIDFKVPKWAKGMIETVQIKKHKFYKEKP